MDHLYWLMCTDNWPEEAVVRTNKKVIFRLNEDWPPATADTGINHAHMDRIFGEEGKCFLYQAGSMCYVACFYLVADVNNSGLRINGENDALRDADVRVFEAKIGCQSDDTGALHIRISMTQDQFLLMRKVTASSSPSMVSSYIGKISRMVLIVRV